jgi:hypothetical protein
MQAKAAAFAGLAAVLLAGYAVTLLSDPGDVVDEADEARRVGPDGESLDPREAAQRERERFAAAGRAFDRRTFEARGRLPDDADEVAPPDLVDAPGAEPTLEGARAGFDYAMRRVEKIAERRRRLSSDQWQVLYREANDAYAALSTLLDAEDPRQRAELEEAHVRLKAGLGEVKVWGDKFRP